jgi:Holliday junction resolvase
MGVTGKSARRKGHDFERWLVRFFNEKGWTSERHGQAKGGRGKAEVTVEEYPLDDFHFEAKRYAKMSIYQHIHQALSDASGSHREACLIFKADHEEPYVAIRLETFERWAKMVHLLQSAFDYLERRG